MKFKYYLVYLFIFVVLTVILLCSFPKTAKEAQVEATATTTPQIVKPVNMTKDDIKRLVMGRFGPSKPILVEIIRCESQYREYNPDGSVLRGLVNPLDVGLGQINEHYWLDKSIELGFNIYTIQGNLDMTEWIYDHLGTQPWSASQFCWHK